MGPKIDFNPYSVLNLDPGCDESQIDKAYKKSALKWHPDKNPDNETKAKEMFLKIYQAYEFLKDKASRTSYNEAIASKRRKTEFEETRRATCSAQRQKFLSELKEREAAFQENSQRKRKSEQRDNDKLIDQFRREGAEMLRRMKEDNERLNAEIQKKTTIPTSRSQQSKQKPQEIFLDDLEELEKAALGNLI
jgi:DnaJ family protein C protein 17